MSEYELDDVRVIKLTTGEVVIGFQGSTLESLEENPELDNYLIIRLPYEVETDVTENESGNVSFGVSCYRWMPFIQDDSLLIQKQNIIAIGMPDDDLLGLYTNLIEMMVLGMVGDGEEN